MPDILHKVAIKASPNDTAKALTTHEGLAGWWTTDTQGDCKPGGVIRFKFGTHGHTDMKVLELDPARRVLWEVLDGPRQWIGTTVNFELAQDGDFTLVRFQHRGWKEPTDAMHHCSTKWAMFLMSMKSLVETGKGAPYPHDVHISRND
jgi:uncharacterized protein YndB with AHSA1/START domain